MERRKFDIPLFVRFPPGLTIFVSFQIGDKISKKMMAILFFSFLFPLQVKQFFFYRKNQTKITSSFFSPFLPISKHIQGKCFLFLFSCLLFPSLQGQLHSKPGGSNEPPELNQKIIIIIFFISCFDT